MTVGDAIEAWDAGDRPGCLRALLEAWRDCRAPELADLIDEVSSEIGEIHPPFKGTQAQRSRSFRTLARAAEPASWEHLKTLLWPKVWTRAMELVEPLLEWPDDPRLAMAFAKGIADTGYASYRTDREFYQPLVARVVAIGDLRVLELLDPGMTQDEYDSFEGCITAFDLRMVGLEQLRDLAVPELDSSDRQSIAVLRGRLSPRWDGAMDALEAQVFANPEHDGPRLVLADALTQAGEKRGEFITLQVLGLRSGDDDLLAAAAVLQKRHGDAWIPKAMRGLCEPGSVHFRRGFVAEARLRALHATGDLNAPCWATLERLEVDGSPSFLHELQWFRDLRGVFGAPGDTRYAAISEGVRWQEVSCRPNARVRELVSVATLQTLVLEEVGEFGLCQEGQVEMALGLLSSLTAVRVFLPRGHRGHCAGFLQALPARVARVMLLSRPPFLDPKGMVYDYRRVSGGWDLTVGHRGRGFKVGSMFETVPVEGVQRVALALPRVRAAPIREAVRAMVASFVGARVEGPAWL